MNYISTLTSWEALTLLFDSRTNMDQRPHSTMYLRHIMIWLHPSFDQAVQAINKKTEKSKSVGRFSKLKFSNRLFLSEMTVPTGFPDLSSSSWISPIVQEIHRLIEATSQTKWKCCGFWFRSSQLALVTIFCSTGLSATFRSRFFFGFLGITTAFFFEPAMTKWLRTNVLIWGKPCPTKDKHCPKNFVGLRHSDSFNSSKCRYTADILSNSWLSCIVFSSKCSSNIHKIILTKKKLKRRMEKMLQVEFAGDFA